MGVASGARPGAAKACGAERLRLLHLGSFRRTPPEPTLPMPAAGAATTTLRRSGPGGVGRRDGARTGLRDGAVYAARLQSRSLSDGQACQSGRRGDRHTKIGLPASWLSTPYELLIVPTRVTSAKRGSRSCRW